MMLIQEYGGGVFLHEYVKFVYVYALCMYCAYHICIFFAACIR